MRSCDLREEGDDLTGGAQGSARQEEKKNGEALAAFAGWSWAVCFARVQRKGMGLAQLAGPAGISICFFEIKPFLFFQTTKQT